MINHKIILLLIFENCSLAGGKGQNMKNISHTINIYIVNKKSLSSRGRTDISKLKFFYIRRTYIGFCIRSVGFYENLYMLCKWKPILQSQLLFFVSRKNFMN